MRFFNKRQKKILTLLGGNICQICKKIINQDAHADHKIKNEKKGKTILQNGQILCVSCNLQKGAKYE